MDSERRAVLLRRYTGLTYKSALDTYEADLRPMADAGYFPVAQSWGWDTTNSPGWLVGGSSWKPGPGTLAVTYRRDGREPG